MKKTNKELEGSKPKEFLARKRHRVVAHFLRREPIFSKLFKSIPPESTEKVFLTKLVSSDRPVLAEEAAKNTPVQGKAMTSAAQRLNEYLNDFVECNLKKLAEKQIQIMIPPKTRGGYSFGYFLSCYDSRKEKFLNEDESRNVLEDAFCIAFGTSSCQGHSKQTYSSILQNLTEKIMKEATDHLERKLFSHNIDREYQPLGLQIAKKKDVSSTVNIHNDHDGLDEVVDFSWDSISLKELEYFKGIYILSSDVGTGKTCFLRKFQQSLINKTGRIPLYIPASIIYDNKIKDYQSFEKYIKSKMAFYLSQDISKGLWLKIREHFVFLIDGLDQISGMGTAYRIVMDSLLKIQRDSKFSMLIASRPTAVVLDKTKEDISFLMLQSFSSHAQEYYFDDHYKRAIDLCEKHRDMLGIPMLAYMVRELIKKGSDQGIKNRTDLYKKFVDYVLSSKGYKHDNLDMNDNDFYAARKVLREVSFKALDQQNKYIQAIPFPWCFEIAKKHGFKMADRLTKLGITNLLDSTSEFLSNLHFTHQSFQEYLATEYICQEGNELIHHVLSEKWNPKWKEVIKFLVGIKGDTIIKQILSESDNPIHSKLFFAAELAPEAQSLNCELRNEMYHEIEILANDYIYKEDANEGLLYVDQSRFSKKISDKLGDENLDVVKETIWEVGALKEKVGIEIVKQIAEKLEDKDIDVVCITIYALSNLKENVSVEIVKKIAKKVEHEDKNVWGAAISILRIFKENLDAAIIKKISSKLEYENIFDLRIFFGSFRGFQEDVDLDIVLKMADKLKDEDKKVVEATLYVLGGLKNKVNSKIFKQIVDAIEDESSDVVAEAIRTIGKIKCSECREAIRHIANKLNDKNERVLLAAIDTLGELWEYVDADIVPKIAVKLEDDRKRIVVKALDALSKFQENVNANTILKIANKLEDNSKTIVRSAIMALGRIKENIGSPIILKIVDRLEDTDIGIVNATIYALERLSDNIDAEILQKITDKFESNNKNVVRATIETFRALKGLMSDEIKEKISEKLEDEDKYIVLAAVDTLGEFNEKIGNETVKRLFEMPHYETYYTLKRLYCNGEIEFSEKL